MDSGAIWDVTQHAKHGPQGLLAGCRSCIGLDGPKRLEPTLG